MMWRGVRHGFRVRCVGEATNPGPPNHDHSAPAAVLCTSDADERFSLKDQVLQFAG